jgi:dolichol-phosphate mannosyltransferase
VSELDIVIPVYNEGAGIARVLDALRDSVDTPFRVLICYDSDEDDTLAAITGYGDAPFHVVLVKNDAPGPLGATVAGFAATSAEAVLVLPADDDYNAARIDGMVAQLRAGHDVVCANRFTRDSRVSDYPWLKWVLVRSAGLLLRHLARFPTSDPTNGMRLFSRRVVKELAVETEAGFAYSFELLAKCHRLGWPIAEIPADWFERRTGTSRFQIARWLTTYGRWFGYAFATTYLRCPPATAPQQRARPPSTLDSR